MGDSKKESEVVKGRPLRTLRGVVPVRFPDAVEVSPASTGEVRAPNELGLSTEDRPLDKGTILSNPEAPIEPHSAPIKEAEDRSVEGRTIVKSTDPKTEL